jgi:hypothetical protein
MSEWKEVWYPWNGHRGERYLMSDNRVVSHEKIRGIIMQLMSNQALLDINCYTIGEGRRRCVCKNGLGHNRFGGTIKCPICNGTGWEYKKLDSTNTKTERAS